MHRLSDTAAAVQEELKKIPELRKRLSNLNLGLFSTDLALVAHGIRTGYLVDVIAPKDPPKTFSHLLSVLRANAITREIFANVLLIYEPTSDQSFFVNTIRLVSRIRMLLPNSESSKSSKADNYPAFLQLHAPFRLLERAPKPLLYLLSSSFMPQPPSSLSCTLPPCVSLETAVPLAAVLLDYPIAYVPSAGYENALSEIALDFYECILAYHKAGGQGASHTIMKFSCPTGLAQGGPTSSERIVQELQTMFAERLSSLGDETMVVTVIHTVQSLDHVAF